MDILHKRLGLLFPEPSQRIPVTWLTWPMLFVPQIITTYMSYLVTKPNTHKLRLLLLPVNIVLSLHSVFGYQFTHPEYQAFSYMFAYAAFVCISRGIEYAQVKQHFRRVTDFGRATSDKKKSDGRAAIDEDNKVNEGPWYLVGLEVMFSVRGIGWDIGLDVHIPHDPRPREKGPFLRATILGLALYYIKFDILLTFLNSVPGLKDGGSIWLPNLSPVPRYIFSTVIQFAVGALILTSIEMVNSVLTLVFVGIFDQSPNLWPPLLDNPWASQSLHELWSKRWHQMLRRVFVYVGGYPGQLVAGRFGLVMGSFLVSAYFHEFGFYTMGKGWDDRVVYFFLIEGFCVVLEGLWRQVTGHRVGGLPGRIWAYLNIYILGQPFINSAITRGAMKGITPPAALSPTRLLLLPIISRFLS